MSYDKIGLNLKNARESRGITIVELSEIASQISPKPISATMISYWENGKRRIYADQVLYLCQAMHISPLLIYGIESETNEDNMLHEIALSLPQDEKDIFYYMFYEWNGNPRALTKFLGLYMALPEELRLDIAGMGISMFKRGMKTDRIISNSPFVDIDYIEKEWEKLM